MSAACALTGHRYRFSADGPTMTWTCSRGCGTGGAKTYDSPAEAARFAAAFDKEDRDDIGRRAPFLGMFPLRIASWLRRRTTPDDPRHSAGPR